MRRTVYDYDKAGIRDVDLILFDVDHFVAGRVYHLPAVARFGGAVTGVIVSIGHDQLHFPWLPGIVLYCKIGILVHELAALQLAGYPVINSLLDVRFIALP